MKTKPKAKRWLITVLTITVILIGWYMLNPQSEPNQKHLETKINPTISSIQQSISTTGTVFPNKRIEITPPISGRIEKVLVKEGSVVKKGQIIAWMSSTERAALLDAANAQGKESLDYWEKAYKPIPLIAAINGKVIVRNIEPGQTVNSSTPVLILADRLMVKAQVDETDIGLVKIGQKAKISLDAYPQIIVDAYVNHIAYEAETVSNVTIYEVDLIPNKIPPEFRSGMSASVEIIQKTRNNVLTIPITMLHNKGDHYFVYMIEAQGKEKKKLVSIGLKDDEKVEILSGIDIDDIIISNTIQTNKQKQAKKSSNPFLPSRKRKK